MPRGCYFCPFFSSWLSTEAASFFASAVVGFFCPLRTLDARVEVGEELCFLAIRTGPLLCFMDSRYKGTKGRGRSPAVWRAGGGNQPRLNRPWPRLMSGL